MSRDGRRAASLVSAVLSNGVQLWDLDTGSRPRTAPTEGTVNDVEVSPDGRWVALAGRTLHIGTWPGRTTQALGPPPGLTQYSAATFAPDSKRLATATFDGKNTTVQLWALPEGSAEWRAETLAADQSPTAHGYTTALAFSHDGARLVASQTDGGVYVWDLDRGGPPIVLRGHSDGANAAAFSPTSDDVLVSGGADGTVRIWRLDEGTESFPITSGVGHIALGRLHARRRGIHRCRD